MQKIICVVVSAVFTLIQTKGQNRNSQWDRPMQLKCCSIGINADVFTATTFLEMEFYNPNDKEIEGLYRFELKPGQAITAFQLDLNGKYRDGSIEEKWKATNAYNTIVGKRIDPALLIMDYADHYSLRIYPVPAKGSRRVTMTIQQLLKEENGNLRYIFPLNVADTVRQFNLDIKVENSPLTPFTKQGLISDKSFTKTSNSYFLAWKTSNIILKGSVAFIIPLPKTPVYCTKRDEHKTHFVFRFKPSIPAGYDLAPKNLTVFWDASASAAKRNLNKEINFLRQFIAYHGISQVSIIPFNHQLMDTAVFYTKDGSFTSWKRYLDNLEYNGATQLGCINLTNYNADLFMIFTDGKNTFGKNIPVTGNSTVHCVYASPFANIKKLEQIVGSNGGKVINLNLVSMDNAVRTAIKSENWLMNITASGGDLVIDQSVPMKIHETSLISGTFSQASNTLFFHYGNNNRSVYVEKNMISSGKACNTNSVDRITMLSSFDKMIRSYNWEETLEFGLKEQVVTPNTAYIVLERVEDYIKYNIEPPADLKEECESQGYVKKNTRLQRKKLQQADEFSMLDAVVKSYNERIRNWDINAAMINLSKVEFDKIRVDQKEIADQKTIVSNTEKTVMTSDLSGDAVMAMNEVVVTTAFGIKKSQRTTPYSSQIIGYEDLNILPQTNLNNALAGKVAGVQFRGQSPINLNSEGFLRIRGGLSLNDVGAVYVVDGTFVSAFDINPADIDDLTVLKGANATALFGEKAKNGAIVINTKKGGRGYNNYWNSYKAYRLEDREDVDYLAEIKEAELYNKMNVYYRLKKYHGDDPGFYFDIAQHLFEFGMKKQAMDILMNAVETAEGNKEALRAMGYVLESWKEFEMAIYVYKQLINDYPTAQYGYRDLAWAYYQNGNYQKAIESLYKIITMSTETAGLQNYSFKAMMLDEMNAMIAIHKNDLDISFLPQQLIRALPVDLRIVVDCNWSYTNNVIIKEPGGNVCNSAKPVSKNGGLLTTDYYWSWYYGAPSEYRIKNAKPGKYRIALNYYDYYSYTGIPRFYRIMTFKNFGKENQSISIENVVMDNQYGEVEIAEVKW